MAEPIAIKKSNTRLLTDTEIRAFAVQKNKIYNPAEMSKQLRDDVLEALTTKLGSVKVMNFITTTPRRFHPYLFTEFYNNSIISSSEDSFTTEVFGTQLDISARFIVFEFEVNNTGVSISSYLYEFQMSKGNTNACGKILPMTSLSNWTLPEVLSKS